MFDIINVDQNEASTRTYFILSPNFHTGKIMGKLRTPRSL